MAGEPVDTDANGLDANGKSDARRGKRPRSFVSHPFRVQSMRRQLAKLTTKRLDGRSAVAVACRRWKDDVRGDLGGNLTRAQETVLEIAAQTWVLLSSLDDWISRQPSLVTRKRQLLPVVRDRTQLADSLARHLERLGLERKVKDADVDAILDRLRGGTSET